MAAGDGNVIIKNAATMRLTMPKFNLQTDFAQGAKTFTPSNIHTYAVYNLLFRCVAVYTIIYSPKIAEKTMTVTKILNSIDRFGDQNFRPTPSNSASNSKRTRCVIQTSVTERVRIDHFKIHKIQDAQDEIPVFGFANRTSRIKLL